LPLSVGTFTLIDVIAVNAMKMSIMHIVYMIAVLDGLTATGITMLMLVVIVDVASITHRIFSLGTCLCHKDKPH